MKTTLLLSLCLLLANTFSAANAFAQEDALTPFITKVGFDRYEDTPGEAQKQVEAALQLAHEKGISWLGAPALPWVLCQTDDADQNFCSALILFSHDKQDQLDSFVSSLRKSDTFQYDVSNKTGNFMSLIYSIDTKDGSFIDCESKVRTTFPTWIDGYMSLSKTAETQAKMSLADLGKVISSTTNCAELNISDIQTVRIEAEIMNSPTCRFDYTGNRTCFLTKGLFSYSVSH